MILNCGYEIGEIVNDETVNDPFIVIGEKCKDAYVTTQEWFPVTRTVEIKENGIIVHDWDDIDWVVQERIEDKHNVISRVVE